MSVKLILILACLGFTALSLSGQDDTHFVKLKPVENKIILNYFCDSIIDMRPNKENIGVVQKGINNKQVVANFSGHFTETLKNHINNNIIKPFDNSSKLVFIIRDFSISERTTATSETGSCFLELEIAQERDSKLYSFGSYYTEVTEGAMDATKSHGKRINKCFQNALQDFNEEGSLNKESEFIDLKMFDEIRFDINLYEETNYYTSFNQLLRGKNLEYFSGKFTETSLAGGIVHFKFKANEKKNRKKKFKFITHNGELYMNALSYCYTNYFVKAKHYGRFIYFEDRFSDPYAAAAFGLMGAALSNNKRSIVLDTSNGLITVLNEKKIAPLIKNHPEIYSEYLKSDKKTSDTELTIKKLNEKLAE